jgi:hypothetical protein
MTHHDSTEVRDDQARCRPFGPVKDGDEIREEDVENGPVVSFGAFGRFP